ncbi:MAG: cobalamin biosynthesis protein CobD [Acidimicrobiia bacterium]|nr:cobalamin biosynthesis protein CobD [Acidimicrobiia bacterium]
MNRLARRCGAVAAGLLLDRLAGEPPAEAHPVAWFGRLMERLEGRFWADSRRRGIAYTVVGVVVGILAGRLVRSVTTAVALTVAGRQLRRVAAGVGKAAAGGYLARARSELPALVGRDPSDLDASGVAAAVIESVAENSVDAVVAPAFWAVVAGAPGALAYRAVNTMDAMVGHRNDRYHRFGWTAARLDDLANYLPARIFAALVAAVAPERAREVLATVRRDAPAHPSPNAGIAEAAVAAALGRELGGPLRYGPIFENRPSLGIGPRPAPVDVARAVDIADRAERVLLAVLGLAWLLGAARRASTAARLAT